MSIKNYIKVVDGVLPINTISQLIKYSSQLNFDQALTIGNKDKEKVKSVRNTKSYHLNKYFQTMSDSHWFNLIESVFRKEFVKYREVFREANFKSVIDIAVLKYEEGGFYQYHIDHHATVPRTMSAILTLNNDYEGGELSFFDELTKEETIIHPKPGRLIIWPSNFIFPHKVNSVKKGTRYSVVIWAL
jgi:Rps23 Pro-64 3,4-dihydroxylase Tpa1-like proline 4-hydroxylase